MSFRIRAARTDDFRSLYNLAKLTGGGFTNLPAEKDTLKAKLDRSEAGFAKAEDSVGEDLYLFMLENVDTKQLRGTCQVFGAVGTAKPFYSYLISTLSQRSEELDRVFRNQTLGLTTDLEGSSEVGGLFLHPNERAGGLGLLLARSRYMFIRQHRARFGDTVLAELRGVMDEAGNSPFWDAIGGRFFGMSFPEADEFNAVHGTQFIADLFPTTRIYVSMLDEAAKAAMGQPHPSGRAALKMLEKEGFSWDGYVDIFDGGPTVTASTDKIRTIAQSREVEVAGEEAAAGTTMLLSAGKLHEFRACYGQVEDVGEGVVAVDKEARKLLGVKAGDTILIAER
ncbi:MAG: arginine N-succinyltransferase [Sphingomicrobium sp.]